MTDIGFSVPEAELGRLATCYQADPSTGEPTVSDAGGTLFARPPAFESGAGGLVSTADDLLAFGRMMLNRGAHGEERILAAPSAPGCPDGSGGTAPCVCRPSSSISGRRPTRPSTTDGTPAARR